MIICNQIQIVFLTDLIFIRIAANLQVKPKVSRHTKESCLAQSGAWSYATLLVYQLVNALITVVVSAGLDKDLTAEAAEVRGGHPTTT